MRLFGRNVEINRNRINVNKFKGEKILIGVSFNRSQMTLQDWKKLFLYLIMPYERLNNAFINNKI